MSCSGNSSKGTAFAQAMVDQTPRYDRKSGKRRKNQVLSKSGLIRKDKRQKSHYF